MNVNEPDIEKRLVAHPKFRWEAGMVAISGMRLGEGGVYLEVCNGSSLYADRCGDVDALERATRYPEVFLFYYFGRKGRLAAKYPAPRHPLVIEPFAGSGAYTLHWNPTDALLIEADVRVVELWSRLTEMTVEELRAYPAPVVGQRTSDLWHLLAMASKDSLSVREYTVSPWAKASFELNRKIAIRSREQARAYTYIHGDFRDAPNVEATWFIDPPYQKVARGYKHGSGGVDYKALAAWVRSRKGQVIVCEQQGADWLPFQPFTVQQNVQSTGHSKEVWWYAEG